MTDQEGSPGLAPMEGNEALWRLIFADGHPDLKKQHRLHTLLPRDPRCRMCLVPFEGLGGWIMRRRGKGRSSRNQHYCSACDGFLEAFPGGAEVDMSILFVDIRNSTAFAERAAPGDVSRRVNLFLDRAVEVITAHDGFIMAFYGDCVVAVWPPGFAGPDHGAKAQRAARALLDDPLFRADRENAIPVGIGVHRGPAYIGTVEAGKGLFRDVSIFGREVNVAARLAARAEPFQALASAAVLPPGTPVEAFELKGIAGRVGAAALG